MNILPYTKKIQYNNATLKEKTVKPYSGDIDERIKKALSKLPCSSRFAFDALSLYKSRSAKQ